MYHSPTMDEISTDPGLLCDIHRLQALANVNGVGSGLASALQDSQVMPAAQ